MDFAPLLNTLASSPLVSQIVESTPPEPMFQRLLDLPPPFNMVVLIVGLGCLASAIKGVATQVRIYADNEADRRLKRAMIDTGLSVEEAERIAAMKVTHSYTPACK